MTKPPQRNKSYRASRRVACADGSGNGAGWAAAAHRGRRVQRRCTIVNGWVPCPLVCTGLCRKLMYRSCTEAVVGLAPQVLLQEQLPINYQPITNQVSINYQSSLNQLSINYQSAINQLPINYQSVINQLSINYQSTINQ